MLKRLLFGLTIATQAALFYSPYAQASPGDIGGEPVKAISPISSYPSVFSQTYIYPYGGAPSLLIVTPGYPYNRIETAPIGHYPRTVIVTPPVVAPIVPYSYYSPYPYYSKPYCGSRFGVTIGKSFSLSSGTISGCW